MVVYSCVMAKEHCTYNCALHTASTETSHSKTHVHIRISVFGGSTNINTGKFTFTYACVCVCVLCIVEHSLCESSVILHAPAHEMLSSTTLPAQCAKLSSTTLPPPPPPPPPRVHGYESDMQCSVCLARLKVVVNFNLYDSVSFSLQILECVTINLTFVYALFAYIIIKKTNLSSLMVGCRQRVHVCV